MTHAIFAAVLTLLAGLFGHALVGAVAAAFFYYGREVTQAEYRWMKAKGALRHEMPWYKGFDVSLWDTKAKLDALLPALTALILALIITRFV